MEHIDPDPNVSYATAIRPPKLHPLHNRLTSSILDGIKEGEWAHQVASVRSMRPGSPEQKAAKLLLPFCTWSGTFTYRSAKHLQNHSGQIGIDLDHVGTDNVDLIIQLAVTDKYCLSAYRSCTGTGVRLIFRIPECSPEQHPKAFEQAAAHVRKVYGPKVIVDTSGSDVSRASFVSHDNGIWIYGNAKVLPIVLDGVGIEHNGKSKDIVIPTSSSLPQTPYQCVQSPYSGKLAMTWSSWYGKTTAQTIPVIDGSPKTHDNLLKLGKSIALHAARIEEPVTDQIINESFMGWIGEVNRRKLKLTNHPEVYKAELVASLDQVPHTAWFLPAVQFWTRWTKHPDYPTNSPRSERLMFAIQKHCEQSKSNTFFLSTRDAAILLDCSIGTVSATFALLVRQKRLTKLPPPTSFRHAQSYALPTPPPLPSPSPPIKTPHIQS